MKLHAFVPQIGASTQVTGVTVLRSGKPGPRVGLMGMLHGNELAGLALWDLAERVGQPARGEIHLIVGHPKAMTHSSGPVRYLERDVNRMFSSDMASSSNLVGPDRDRCLELMPILAGLDVLIDVHSTSSPSDPFALISGADPRGIRLGATLPISHIYGFERLVSGTAASWVVRHGGSAITIEVGQHDDPRGPEIAYEMTLRILNQLDMVTDGDRNCSYEIAFVRQHVAILRHVKSVYPGFAYARPFMNFDRLQPAELIGWDEEAFYRAPDIGNAVIIMPAAPEVLRNGTGTDVFFVGVELDFLPNILDQIHADQTCSNRFQRRGPQCGESGPFRPANDLGRL